MMLGDDEIKEIISIHEVCLTDKFYKKDLGLGNEPLFTNSSTNELEVPPRYYRDGFYPEVTEQQARFAWTEEDGNIASLVSDPGFGTTGQTTFGKDLDVQLKTEMKEADTSSSVFEASNRSTFQFLKKKQMDPPVVTSTSTSTNVGIGKCNQGAWKIDKADPRSRYHYVKYVKRHGRTVKLWECGICSREFQHQYTLMRHLPTHTDERNFHCVACGKSFRQLSTLSQHRAIHSAERPYSCEVCNKTFNRVSTLISHRKTHSDEKPYKCHICPKGFHQKGNLRNHLFTHTNERPYRCNICHKGFNQQSNLVCHKNKAHPDENSNASTGSGRSIPRSSTTNSVADSQVDSTGSSNQHCEVTSTVGSYPPAEEQSSTWMKDGWPRFFTEPINAWCYTNPWGGTGTGVVVDPIKTYHMGVALATRQTPFALLKPDKGAPVLVKVVDTKLPGGKQMLVPATAEDLRDGGKIIMKNDGTPEVQSAVVASGVGEGALQIKVPVVATVVPRILPGGRLRLCVEEPHHAYHTALSAEAPCTSSSCALPPPAPSPPLDLIPMDLFEPMECLPMESLPFKPEHSSTNTLMLGDRITSKAVVPPQSDSTRVLPPRRRPQITPVDNVQQPPGSDDSDIYISSFEESIPLSDSE